MLLVFIDAAHVLERLANIVQPLEHQVTAQGLDLEITNFVTASEMIPLMVTGRLDAGHGATGPAILNAMLAGADVKYVSDVAVLRDPSSGFKNMFWVIVRKDLVDSGQVRSVADLKGRKIGQPQGRPHIYMENALRYHGLGIDGSTRLPGPEGQLVPLTEAAAVAELFRG